MNCFIFIIIFCEIAIIVHISGTQDHHVSLRCPNDLKVIGYAWYAKQQFPNQNHYESTVFAICVKCQPESDIAYESFEVCLSNTFLEKTAF